MTSAPRYPTLLIVALLLTACLDSRPPTAPTDRQPSEVARAEDVEALVGGSMAGWWRAAHNRWPGPALSAAADAHTTAWRNWGMLAAASEPRQPLVTDPDDRFNFTVPPYVELTRTLVAVRDAMLALDAGAELGEKAVRARAFGSFMQGLALGSLALLYDEAYVLDETVDPAGAERSPYGEVMAAALARLDDAVALSEANDFTVPAPWVAFAADMESDRLARLARSFRARFRMHVARSPSERAAADWGAILADAESGIRSDWAGFYDGEWEENWALDIMKWFVGSFHAWGRLDYRTIGPADASGRWLEWIHTPPAERQPFLVDTDDRRITGDDPTSDGLYTEFHAEARFPAHRGTDHFSFYADRRRNHFVESGGAGEYVDFPVKELDFIRAEALYRLGDRAGAMAIVNQWRAHGELPPFTDPDGPAPGGARCVPRMIDGSCGDLFEALQYEKRIEVYHYGPYTEYLDDRGWGDLVEGTFVELPAPDVTLAEILEELYGVGDGTTATSLANQSSAGSVRLKLEGIVEFDATRNTNPLADGAG